MNKRIFLNNKKKCGVCGCDPEEEFELIKHHVSYFPNEIIIYVHYACHKLIHDGKKPHLIQYQEGDSRLFYKLKKEKNSKY
tara:strand:- start:147 stop:389 length:243 start_codon:yes stop_codon:yes gene_type:complete